MCSDLWSSKKWEVLVNVKYYYGEGGSELKVNIAYIKYCNTYTIYNENVKYVILNIKKFIEN